MYHPAKTHVVHHPEQGHEESYEIPATGHYESVQVQNGYDWVNTSGVNENTGEWEEGKGSGWSATDGETMNGQATSYMPHYDTETE